MGDPWKAEQPDIFFNEPFQFKSERIKDEWRLGFEKQGSGEDATELGRAYAKCVYIYAARLAACIEMMIEADPSRTLSDVVDEAEKTVDKTENMGVTGAQHGMACSLLYHCWVRGEELRAYYRKGFMQ